MIEFFRYVKRWNEWRKHSLNSSFYKFLVLLGIVKSPTLLCTLTKEEWEEVVKAIEKAREGVEKQVIK